MNGESALAALIGAGRYSHLAPENPGEIVTIGEPNLQRNLCYTLGPGL
jgi:hypothetical protein